MTDEEIQLRREEQEDAGEGDRGSERPEESYTEEWSEEDRQLRREEREAGQESDDWWLSCSVN